MSAGLHWSRNSAEARALFLQSYRQAAEALEALVAGRDPFTWAISIDGDETLLDNSPYQLEREAAGLGFTEESWNEWVRRREAPALPGARDFLETVRRLGGKIAVVTNRGEVVCGATEDNLRNLRLPYDLVLCKPTGAESDKSPRWQAVEEGRASKYLPPLDLVLWVGDNVHDFPGGSQEWARGPEDDLDRFGRDFVILPNVMYGSWERNPQE
jgi:5'-nucleotidase (lipoprotein e(P4) family)